ncbi:unnamed protein product [Brassica napus]|uniref:(rape) hypothetical protein n=1 Tax=Brassica napus TaxID=3708 RepID=A0A816L1X8_BRANA|nr:unnamed protein product [Brassica napus]
MDAFERKYGSHGVNVTSEEEDFEEPVENIGWKHDRQAASKTSDLAGHGVGLAQGFIDECAKVILLPASSQMNSLIINLINFFFQVVAAGANPALISIGIEKTEKALVNELNIMSKGSNAGRNDPEAGSMIAEAMSKVGKNGVVVIDEGKTAENKVYVVEGMQFEPGYMSPYFITDHETERMCVEYDHFKVRSELTEDIVMSLANKGFLLLQPLLVDHKITNAKDLDGVLEDAIKGRDPIIIIAEDFEQEALETLVVNKVRELWNVAAVKAPGGSRELKSKYFDDIAILTGATVIREEDGLSLDKAGKEVLGNSYKVVLTKEMTTIVGDGTTHEAVNKRVAEIKNLIEQAEQGYEKETLNERLAKLSGGVAVIQVGGQTETERREKKLKFEAALNGTKGAIEEGTVVGGGCTFLGLADKVDPIKDTLENEEEKIGADIVKKALSNAGEGGSVVSEEVVRGSLEHAFSTAKWFLMPDVKGPEARKPVDISG